ncbi:MAG: peptide deformylase [Ignavibacteria bacterium]|nr:peptide deformylase [Ignavibacteria bacterium]
MAVLPINIYGDEILRQKAKKVTKIDGEFLKFIEDLFETMKQSDGIGLAATQVGKRLQVLVADISEVEGYENTKPMVVINPKIILTEGESEMEEGCLSLPGLRVNVKRPEKIRLKYNDIELKEHIEDFEGLQARVLQHEIDHLNGKLIIDYLSKTEKEKVKPLLEKMIKREFEVHYPVTSYQVISK